MQAGRPRYNEATGEPGYGAFSGIPSPQHSPDVRNKNRNIVKIKAFREI